MLWNQWSDRDKCYYEIKREGNKYEIGQKYTVFNSTFEYLVQNFNHKYDRDKFTTVDKSGIHKMQLKDKKKLAKFIKDTLQEQLRSDSSGTNSCTLLTFNKLKNVYTLFHGNRKEQQLSVIESNQIGDSMKQANYTNNNRIVHSHFDNIWFDGIDKIKLTAGDSDFIKKIPDKTHFAKELGVEDVMNFPVDKRSPIIRIIEHEESEGDMMSKWEFYCKLQHIEHRFMFAISPQSCTYSFCKSTAIYREGNKYCQHF